MASYNKWDNKWNNSFKRGNKKEHDEVAGLIKQVVVSVLVILLVVGWGVPKLMEDSAERRELADQAIIAMNEESELEGVGIENKDEILNDNENLGSGNVKVIFNGEPLEDNNVANINKDNEEVKATSGGFSLKDLFSRKDKEEKENVEAEAEISEEVNEELEESGAVKENKKDEYFASYRVDREKERSGEIALLQEIIDSKQSSQNAKDKAVEKIINITDQMEKEMALENYLNGKYFIETAVFISENGVNVLLASGEKQFSDNEIKKIAQIASEETKLPFDKVKIVLR